MTPVPWPLAVFGGAAVAVAAGMIGLSALLGQRHRERATIEPYESGVPATEPGRLRLSSRYYVVAMLFLVFDVEAVFFVVWAATVRRTGWAGFAGALVFLAVLLAVLFYEARAGALGFALAGRDVLRRMRRMGTGTGGRT